MGRFTLLLGKGEGLSALKEVCKDIDYVALSDTDYTIEEIAHKVDKMQGIDFAIANGLVFAPIVDLLKNKGVAVVGPDSKMEKLERDRVYGKILCSKAGIGTGKWFTIPVEKIDEIEWEFPCYIKHIDGLGGTTSFKVDSVRQIKNLILAYGYPEGLVVEKPLDGLEFSINVMIGKQDWKLLGMNYDVKDSVGKVVENVYSAPTTRLNDLVQNKFKMLFDSIQLMGYTGILALTIFITEDGIEMIEMNARLGYGSAFSYLNNVKNSYDMLRSCAYGESIPDPQFKNAYGLEYMVNSGLKREEYDLIVGLLRPLDDTVYLIKNNIINFGVDFSNGSAPYVLATYGDSIKEIEGRIYRNLSRVDVPLLERNKIDMSRLDKIEERLVTL